MSPHLLLYHFCQIIVREASTYFFILFRFDLESGILWWITAQFSRNLTVLAFDSPFPLGAKFCTFLPSTTICLSIIDQLPMILILLLTLFSKIGSHQSSFCIITPFVLNFTFSVIDTCLYQLGFAHLNISSTCPVILLSWHYGFLLSSVTEIRVCFTPVLWVTTIIVSKCNTDALDSLINCFY